LEAGKRQEFRLRTGSYQRLVESLAESAQNLIAGIAVT